MKLHYVAPSKRGLHRSFFFLFLALSFSLYANSFGNGFVFDDVKLVLENEDIRSLANLASYLPGSMTLSSYRPIRFLSYLIDYQLYGLNSYGYRISNILYHSLNTYLIFRLMMLLGATELTAFLGAVLFLTHPVQTESVAYIAGRRDLLFTLFYLFSFIYFIKNYNRMSAYRTVLLLLLMLLSFFSKEMAASLPIMLFWYALWRERLTGHQEDPGPSNWLGSAVHVVKKFTLLFSIVFGTGMLFVAYKIYIWNPAGSQPYWGGSLLTTFLTMNTVWVYYIGLILLPIPLKGDYSIAAFPVVESTALLLPWLCGALLVTFCVLSLSLVRKKPLITFATFWFVISLLPVSQIIPHHEMMAEHYLYLPLVGFALGVGSLFSSFWKGRARSAKYGAIAVFLALICSFSWRVLDRNLDWRDSFTFWKSTCRFEPFASRASLNLGTLYDRRGNEELFLDYTRRSLEIKPNEKAHYNLGVHYYTHQQYEQAIIAFTEAIHLNGTFQPAFHNLAVLYKDLKEYGLALEKIKSYPNSEHDPEMVFIAAIIYFDQQDYAQAISNLRKLETLQSDFQGLWYFMGLSYEALQDYAQAVACYQHGLPLRNKYYSSMYQHYYTSLGNMGDYDVMKRAITEFLVEFPDNQDALLNLGRLSMVTQDVATAERTLQKILAMDDRCAECYLGLGMIHKNVYLDFPRALEYLRTSLQLDPDQSDRDSILDIIAEMESELSTDFHK